MCDIVAAPVAAAAGLPETVARATELAPCEEEAYLRLMRHHQALGRPERVRQAYWDCRKAFKAWLGGVPSEDFERTYAALLR